MRSHSSTTPTSSKIGRKSSADISPSSDSPPTKSFVWKSHMKSHIWNTLESWVQLTIFFLKVSKTWPRYRCGNVSSSSQASRPCLLSIRAKKTIVNYLYTPLLILLYQKLYLLKSQFLAEDLSKLKCHFSFRVSYLVISVMALNLLTFSLPQCTNLEISCLNQLWRPSALKSYNKLFQNPNPWRCLDISCSYKQLFTFIHLDLCE